MIGVNHHSITTAANTAYRMVQVAKADSEGITSGRETSRLSEIQDMKQMLGATVLAATGTVSLNCCGPTANHSVNSYMNDPRIRTFVLEAVALTSAWHEVTGVDVDDIAGGSGVHVRVGGLLLVAVLALALVMFGEWPCGQG